MFTGTLREFQKPAVDTMVERGQALVAYDMGLGKGNRCCTPVLTPSGWVRADAVRVGDQLVGSDGRPTDVVGVFPQGEQDIYRVSFTDGSWVDVDEAHLWAVKTPNDRARGGSWRTVSVRQILDEQPVEHTGKRLSKWLPKVKQGNGNSLLSIPMVQPVVFDPLAEQLPLDPYVLGVVLGDGSCSHHHIVVIEKGSDTETLRSLVNHTVETRTTPKGFSMNLPVLRSLGLLGCRSWEKFVPEQYLRSTPEQRLALLQGLMDTDGYAHPDGGTEFSTTSPMLRDAVVELAQSLGGVASFPGDGRCTTYTRNGEKRIGRRSWRVNVRMPSGVNPFRLPRKASQYVLPTKYVPSRWIESIEHVGRDETVCFKVSADDELYVTKDYIVTHNTVLSIAAIERLLDTEEVRGGLVVATASLLYQWADEIKKFTDGALALVIDGSPQQRALLYKRAYKYEYVILSYNTVVNDWQQVKRLERDFVILDEAVAIKSFTSDRSRTVKKLNAPFRFALTGQPVENRPEELFSIMQWVDEDVLGDFEQFDRTFIVRSDWGGVERYRKLPLLHERMADVMIRKKRTDPDVRDEMPDVEEETELINIDSVGRNLYRIMIEDLQVELMATMRGNNWDIFSHYGEGGSDGDMTQTGQIMSRITCLRMLCDHPELLQISATKFDGRAERDGIKAGSAYAAELRTTGTLPERYGTPKLDTFLDRLEQILSENGENKVVVFSFFKDMLSIINDAIAKHPRISKKTGTVLFTGDMNAKDRDAAKKKFQTNPNIRVFLSSDAGGVGVDLPQANYLCNIDLPWSAGKIDQRNARIIRLSSEWDKVILINFLIRGSIEERQYALLEQKRLIAAAWVDGTGHDENGQLELTLSTLSAFIEESSV